MSVRREPQTTEEHLAYIYELLRRLRPGDAHTILSPTHVDTDVSRPAKHGEVLTWDEAQGRWKPAPGSGIAEHTLIFHIPSTVAIGVYEPIVPMFGATITAIRGNVATAPSGGDVEFAFRVNGVSVSTLPAEILDTTTLGVTLIPDITTAWVADDVLDIEVIAINGATGLVISIDHTRD